jgi:hypothetical protein
VSWLHLPDHAQIESVAACASRGRFFAALRVGARCSLLQHALSNIIARKEQ